MYTPVGVFNCVLQLLTHKIIPIDQISYVAAVLVTMPLCPQFNLELGLQSGVTGLPARLAQLKQVVVPVAGDIPHEWLSLRSPLLFGKGASRNQHPHNLSSRSTSEDYYVSLTRKRRSGQ